MYLQQYTLRRSGTASIAIRIASRIIFHVSDPIKVLKRYYCTWSNINNVGARGVHSNGQHSRAPDSYTAGPCQYMTDRVKTKNNPWSTYTHTYYNNNISPYQNTERVRFNIIYNNIRIISWRYNIGPVSITLRSWVYEMTAAAAAVYN
jgi:hypothetical protein